jgi:N-acetylmuramic acid 6-phosphate etherase
MNAKEQSQQFLAQSGEFRLGDLTTEKAHPVTLDLSETAKRSVPEALRLLFRVDADVVNKYREWAATGAPNEIAKTVLSALKSGGRVFYTGCGATGRLSILMESIWREFWAGRDAGLADRVFSVMSGGDYALIKSVEGFEDFTRFGEKQIGDMGVREGDVVFAITEGGETSFVIGTAWQGVRSGAKVYFVYDNPDDVLRAHVARSREVIDEPRIEKINLTTGPMAIMGSTRMQATSIQLCAMLAVMEIVVQSLLGRADASGASDEFLKGLEAVYESLLSDEVIDPLAKVVEMEAETYRRAGKSTYFADHLGIDVLTDTTERSPTFCTPAFRKWDDENASESWAYLILPRPDSVQAWDRLLKRAPRCLAWTPSEIKELAGAENAPRQTKIMREIGPEEILRFRIGLNGLQSRPIAEGDIAVSVASECELESLADDGFFRSRIEDAERSGARTAVLFAGTRKSISEAESALKAWKSAPADVFLPVPETTLALDGIARVGMKMLLNALSTCVMVTLGRVMGNCMVAVVPSNLKLIDRSIRYIRTLTGLSYEDACDLLFEAIEYVKPRMQSAQSYPPPVELSFVRFQRKCTLQQAEEIVRDSHDR